MKPLVSVIIPVYNVELYITKCINSISNQTYKYLEIILVDDGSKDKSSVICDELADKDTRIVVFHNANHGPSFSRNFGLEKSHGEYITFIDSDDWIETDYIEKLMQPFLQEDVDLTICPYYMDYPKYSFPIEANKRLISKVLKDDLLYLYYLTMGPYCKMYKKAIIEKYSISFPEDISFSEDRVFNYRYIEHSRRYSYIDKLLYHYCHYQENSLSQSRKMKSYNDAVNVLMIEKEFLQKIKAKDTKKMIFKSACFYIGCFTEVADGDNSYKGFSERFKIIREISKGSYSFDTFKEALKSIVLYFDLPWLWYMKRYLKA